MIRFIKLSQKIRWVTLVLFVALTLLTGLPVKPAYAASVGGLTISTPSDVSALTAGSEFTVDIALQNATIKGLDFGIQWDTNTLGVRNVGDEEFPDYVQGPKTPMSGWPSVTTGTNIPNGRICYAAATSSEVALGTNRTIYSITFVVKAEGSSSIELFVPSSHADSEGTSVGFVYSDSTKSYAVPASSITNALQSFTIGTSTSDADIATAIGNIEAATYTATQAEAGDATAAGTKAQALVNALELAGTTAVVVPGTFTAAVAGTSGTPAGTNGSYTFTVTINKAGGTEQTSAQNTMTIIAQKYGGGGGGGQEYTITITEAANGSTSGAGVYEEGDTVTLNAVPDSNYNFDGWYEGETKVSSLPGYTFTATRDMTLTPVFVAMQQGYLEVTTVGGGTVTLNGDAVPLSANYKLQHFRGTPITLTAVADSNYTFAYWEDVKSASIVSTDTIYESVMGSGINVKSVFVPAPTEASTYYNVIFKDKSGKILQSTNVAKDTSASPPVSPTIAGYDFTGWDVDYTNVTGNIITGALYTRAATKYAVTVIGGTLSTGGTSGEYQFDWPVTIVADSAPTGQKFSHWTMNDVKVSTKTTFAFYVPQKATTLTAVFVDESTLLDNSPFITLSPDVIIDYTNKIIMFTAIRNIPAEYTLVESGVLLLESDTALSEDLTVDTASVIRGKISNASTDQFYIRKTNVTDGDTWYGRAYLIYQDANSNIVTVYSGNTISGTMSGGE